MSKATDAEAAKVLEAAQAMRIAHHTERGREEADLKAWDDLAPEKQQRWLDKANGED